MQKFPLMVSIMFAVVVLSHSANAGYINNYSDWKKMTIREQGWYAMGLWDMSLVATPEENNYAKVNGLVKCGSVVKFNGVKLAEAMTRFYEVKATRVSQPPIMAFYSEIIKGVCLEYVNKARADYGLKPWPKTED